jgi:hypothetical protein
MRLTIVSLLLAAGAAPHSLAEPPILACDSVMIEHVRDAAALARAAAARHQGRTAPYSLAYAGAAAMEAHLPRPGMLRTTPYRLDLLIDPVTLDLTMRETRGTGEAASTRTTIVRGTRAAAQAREGTPFTELHGDEALSAIEWARWWSPVTIAHAMTLAQASCRRTPSLLLGSTGVDPVTFVDPAGRSCTAMLDAEHRILRVERVFSSGWLGDACDWITFEGESAPGVPAAVTRFSVLDDVTLRHTLTAAPAASAAGLAAPGMLPPDHRADVPDWESPGALPVEFVPLAEGVAAFEDTLADVRLLVVERDTDLVVLSAPCGDDVSTRFARAIHGRFPQKPIAIVAFGHHHPASSGGLRTWAAAGAEIVAPRGLEPYVRTHLARPTTLGAPAIEGPSEPRLRFFDDRLDIPCTNAAIELLDIKDRSNHAAHYTVFHVRGPGILFEDDLGYFPTNGAASAGPRLIGLADALNEAGIVPTRLVQQWPVKGVVREVGWSTVTGLVDAAKEKASRAK